MWVNLLWPRFNFASNFTKLEIFLQTVSLQSCSWCYELNFIFSFYTLFIWGHHRLPSKYLYPIFGFVWYYCYWNSFLPGNNFLKNRFLLPKRRLKCWWWITKIIQLRFSSTRFSYPPPSLIRDSFYCFLKHYGVFFVAIRNNVLIRLRFRSQLVQIIITLLHQIF